MKSLYDWKKKSCDELYLYLYLYLPPCERTPTAHAGQRYFYSTLSEVPECKILSFYNRDVYRTTSRAQ